MQPDGGHIKPRPLLEKKNTNTPKLHVVRLDNAMQWGYPTPKRCSLFQSVYLARTGAALCGRLLARVVVLGGENLGWGGLLTGSCAGGASSGSWLAHGRLLLLNRSASTLLGDIESGILLVLAGHLIAAALLAASNWLLGGGLDSRSFGSSDFGHGGRCSGLICGDRTRLARDRCGCSGDCRSLLGSSFGSSSGGRRCRSRCRSSWRKKLNQRHLALRGGDAIDASLKS